MSTKQKHAGIPSRHPLSALFPEHGGEPLEKLAKSIKEHGQKHPIVLYEGMTLDGWRRGLACEKAGVEPQFIEFKGTRREAAEYVWIENYHRRHLQIGELAIVAARYQQWLRDNPEEANGEKLGDVPSKFQVSRASVEAAAKVINDAEPEVLEAVEKGVISVSDGAKVAAETPKVQRSSVKDVMDRMAKTAAEAAKKAKSRNGQPVYDDKLITDPYGKLVRACVDRRKAMGMADNDAGYSKVNELLRQVYEALQAWGIR